MWEDTYLSDVDKAATTARVARRLGVRFEQRESSYFGEYFRVELEGAEIQIKENLRHEGELVHPRLPETVYVVIDGKGECPQRSRLAEIEGLTLFESTEWP